MVGTWMRSLSANCALAMAVLLIHELVAVTVVGGGDGGGVLVGSAWSRAAVAKNVATSNDVGGALLSVFIGSWLKFEIKIKSKITIKTPERFR